MFGELLKENNIIIKKDTKDKKDNKDKKDKKDKKKRSPSVYNIFVSENMAKLKISEPDMPNPDRLKKASKIWSGLSEEEKKLFADNQKN